jgi:hypothetical protein
MSSCRDRNSAIMKRLGEIQKSQAKFQVQGESGINLIRDDILRLTKITLPKGDIHDASQTAELTSLYSKLVALNREQARCTHQMSILKSLYFADLSRRWSRIVDAADASNEWMFDRQRIPFMMWLESSDEDDGLFYITGRVCAEPLCPTIITKSARLEVGNQPS